MEQIGTQLVSDKVVAALRHQILYGILKPHQELYQDKIAQELGVSRMPVREALQVLAHDGFITIRPNKVAIVNEVSQKFIRDFYDVRILLETRAIQLACQNQPDCSPAWEAYSAGEAMISAGNFNGYNHENSKIHQFIWSAADNTKLQQILRQMWHIMSVGKRPEESARASHLDHYHLIRSIEENDVALAEKTIQAHIERSYQRVLEAVNRHA